MQTKRILKGFLQVLAVVALGLALGPVLYFQYHSSDAPTLSVISGAIKLDDPKVPYVEIEQGIYMFRAADVSHSSPVGMVLYPCNPYLASLGWSLFDQMGAMVYYKRGDQILKVSDRSCGSHYAIAVLHQDPVSGKDIAHPKPFNLFGP